MNNQYAQGVGSWAYYTPLDENLRSLDVLHFAIAIPGILDEI